MRIGLLGGVLGFAHGARMLSAPENVLLGYLREAGHDVVPMSIGDPPRFDPSIDVYHAHHFGIGAYALAMARTHPLVFTSHDPFVISDVPSPASRVDRLFRPQLLAEADTIVALSSREAALLRERFRLGDGASIAVIPNGLDLGLYAPPSGEPTGTDVLSVGQLLDYKGHEYLVRAVARLVPRFPDLRLSIVTTRRDLQPALERLAAELGIAQRLSFEGPYETADLVRRYQACTLFVQPSLAECFPVTVLEAMACGRPVVASDVGGVAEELGDAGVTVPPRDVDALAAAIDRLLASEQERKRLGEAAVGRCRERYDGRRVAAQHVELYEELVRSGPRRHPSPVRRAAAGAVFGALRKRQRLVRT